MTYEANFQVKKSDMDEKGCLKPASILYFAQEVAGAHATQLGTGWDVLQQKGLFWAVIRTRAEVYAQPKADTQILVKTWPMPTTRTAYPRCVMGYDEKGTVLFKVLSLWVLMDVHTRAMVLPGKSGVVVEGIAMGDEPASPRALPSKEPDSVQMRTVTTAQLDRNGHMNNTRYMDWVMELSSFQKPVKSFDLCYFNEGRLGDIMELGYSLQEDNLVVDIHRTSTDVADKKERIFAASVAF